MSEYKWEPTEKQHVSVLQRFAKNGDAPLFMACAWALTELAAARAEVEQWRRAFADVARELGALYATTPDGNDHVLRKTRQIASDLAAVRKVERWVQRGNDPIGPEHLVVGLAAGRFGAFVRGTHTDDEFVASGRSLAELGRALAAQEADHAK